jgi:hypothetical protein
VTSASGAGSTNRECRAAMTLAGCSRLTSEKRRVWTLGAYAWCRVPFLRRLAAAVGTFDGTPRNADQLLSHMLPGGLRETVKPHERRY